MKNSLLMTACDPSSTLCARVQELELLERRGTSLKTKAETQAKYGW